MPGPELGTVSLEMNMVHLLPLRSSETKGQDSHAQRSKGNWGSWAPQGADSETELGMQGALGINLCGRVGRRQDEQKEIVSCNVGLLMASATTGTSGAGNVPRS